MTARTTPRIAIVCDNASFKMGGEAAIPLRFFKTFRALGHKPKLLTHIRVQAELAASLTPDELSDVVFFDDQLLQKVIFRAGKYLPSRLREIFVYGLVSILTERRQARYLRSAVRTGDVNIVFQPTPISPKALSFIRVPGAPVFFGPLNGAMDYPPAFRAKDGRMSDLIVSAGRSLSEPLHRLFRARSKAAGIFVSNQRTLDALPRATRNVPTHMSFDATVDSNQWRDVARSDPSEPNHFLYVGRLVDWKAVDFAILATHALGGRAKLTIVGDGPERARLQALAADGPGEIVFAGYMPHDALKGLYSKVCAQVLPSLREAGGNVCMEALAAGVPVIATKWGGALDVVQDGVDGILVDPVDAGHLVDGMARAMQTFMDNPEQARLMGARGRLRVLDAFGWDRKSRDYLAVFEDSLKNG